MGSSSEDTQELCENFAKLFLNTSNPKLYFYLYISSSIVTCIGIIMYHM